MAEGGVSSGIDFVVTWVDGSDPAWRREREACSGSGGGFGHSEARFRDWGLLRYWFRGVEKFAPWVDRIHFVTWGHLPAWLDTAHPKLHIVNHRDFIPPQYLPTFNSNAIELNMHRIEGLSEKFVYFNDDVFLLDDAPAGFFFRGGLPRDFFCLDAPKFAVGTTGHTVGEDLVSLNESFKAKDVYAANRWKMLAPSLGWRRMLRNIVMRRIFDAYIPGFENRHSFQSFRKSTFEAVWNAAADRMDATCRNRFRTSLDSSHWLMRYWQIAGGEYFAASPARYGCAHLTPGNAGKWAGLIRSRRYAALCVNDNALLGDFEAVRDEIAPAFESILPERSSFERTDDER